MSSEVPCSPAILRLWWDGLPFPASWCMDVNSQGDTHRQALGGALLLRDIRKTSQESCFPEKLQWVTRVNCGHIFLWSFQKNRLYSTFKTWGQKPKHLITHTKGKANGENKHFLFITLWWRNLTNTTSARWSRLTSRVVSPIDCVCLWYENRILVRWSFFQNS